jgi:hypothetical protein
MNKKIYAGVLAVLTLAIMVDPVHSANAQVRPSPTPILIAAPSFSCGVTVSGSTGQVTIKKTNATAVDKTTDVVAIINTPSGKVSTSVCGSAFASAAVGTSVNAPFAVPATTDKSWIYTCSASQTKTTSACNPPK